MALSLGASVAAVAGGAVMGGASVAAASTAARTAAVSTAVSAPGALQVVASGLNSPRHLTVGPDGALYVAEAGLGGPAGGSNCQPTRNQLGVPTSDCVGPTGVVARVTTTGSVSTALAGLPSVETEPTSAPPVPPEFTGPAAVDFVNGKLEVVTQDALLTPSGGNSFGPAGADLGMMITATPGQAPSSWTVGPDFGAYAAANPQTSYSLGAEPIPESATDNDPYAIIPYQGGWVVVNAGSNALLDVSPTGVITTLASFPAQAGTGSQAVPTSVVVGPDGAFYVGELVGVPSVAGSAVVYRVVPGQAPTVYASGFSSVSDLAFDRSGRLVVLEFNVNGLLDPTHSAPGAVIRVEADGSRTVLASAGLSSPTGMAIGPDGSVYVSNNGDTAGAGTIVRVPLSAQDGYQEVAADGGAFTFGTYGFLGSLGGIRLNQPIVATASARLSPGYWSVASDGGVFTFGTAGFYGSLGGTRLNAPIVGMAATPDARGYWLVASDGGVFAFGDATFSGSEGGQALNKPIVAIAATPDGGGYWLVASDGGVFAFGDATFSGSEGGQALNKPIVGATGTPDGGGYWLVASDGGVFSFGDAAFSGSEGGQALNKPIVAMASDPASGGYYLIAADGGIFSFGGAQFFGSEGGARLNSPVVGLS